MKLLFNKICAILITLSCVWFLPGCDSDESRLELMRYQRSLSAKNNEIDKLKKQLQQSEEKLQELQALLSEQRETALSFGTDAVKFKTKNAELLNELNDTRKDLASIGKKYSSLQRMLIARGETVPNPGEEVIVHYWRLNDDYKDWGVHAWGPAIRTPIDWKKPVTFNRSDDFGVYTKLELNYQNAYNYELNFLLHNGDQKDLLENRAFNAGRYPEIWLVQSEPTIHYSLLEAEATKRRIKRDGLKPIDQTNSKKLPF